MASSGPDEKQFIFIDESGDPGPAGDPLYILAALHMSGPLLNHVRYHDASFRYHTQIIKEYKDQGWAPGIGQAGLRLLLALADLTGPDQLTATVTWLRKSTYIANGGPYLRPGESRQFRHFQVRLLLEQHRTVRVWTSRLDVVLDRWEASPEGRRNLEDYLRGNYSLRPQIETVTLVDSLYADLIQIVDLYTRLARLVVDGRASAEHAALAGRLFSLHEITRGKY
jgi:Protein of unknown function (DUF3800)